jgi:hypothetical protein
MSVLTLPSVPEPAEVRERWWEAERTGAPSVDLVAALTDVVWNAWGTVLHGAGADRAWVAAVLDGYRRELWLWTARERTWEQTASGLAGRVVRRLPA